MCLKGGVIVARELKAKKKVSIGGLTKIGVFLSTCFVVVELGRYIS